MIVRILTRFHDKDNFTKVYEVDDVVDFEPKRALELIKLSLVMEVDQQSPKDSGKEVDQQSPKDSGKKKIK